MLESKPREQPARRKHQTDLCLLVSSFAHCLTPKMEAVRSSSAGLHGPTSWKILRIFQVPLLFLSSACVSRNTSFEVGSFKSNAWSSVIERHVTSVDQGNHYGMTFIMSMITNLDKLRISSLYYSSQTKRKAQFSSSFSISRYRSEVLGLCVKLDLSSVKHILKIA